MNFPCRVTQELNDYEHSNSINELIRIARDHELAISQLERVQQTALGFMNNMNTIVTQRKNTFDSLERKYVVKDVQVVYGMEKVAERFCEGITASMVLGLLKGEPQALHKAQYLIGEAAHEIAFEALDLASNPFLDLEELRNAAGE